MSSNYLYSPRVNETSSFACVRPLMTTLPPFATNYFSASAPIPDPSPVMTATLFSNLIVLSFCLVRITSHNTFGRVSWIFTFSPKNHD